MAHPSGARSRDDLRLYFDRRVRLEFRGSQLSSDAPGGDMTMPHTPKSKEHGSISVSAARSKRTLGPLRCPKKALVKAFGRSGALAAGVPDGKTLPTGGAAAKLLQNDKYLGKTGEKDIPLGECGTNRDLPTNEPMGGNDNEAHT
jgi:hypothetical protein